MQGTIAFVNEKNWNGKTLYSFKLTNDQTLYTCGTSKPQASKGDFVTFDGKEGAQGRFEVDTKSLNVKRAEVVQASGNRSWKPDTAAYDKRQETIEWQAARNSAIAAANVVIQAGALKLPAKEADKYSVVLMLISELTNKFFKETKTLGTEIEVPEEPEKPEKIEMHGTEGEWD